MVNENFTEKTAKELKFAQEVAADLYEQGATPSDLVDVSDRDRELVKRMTEKPSPRALVAFLEHERIKWGRKTDLNEVEMPKIVRLRLGKLFELRNELASSGQI
jgi:hypothetical protein